VVGEALAAERQGSTNSVAWFTSDEVDMLDRVELVDAARRTAGIIG
jgi:8-oxo-dGTP diphosphatase